MANHQHQARPRCPRCGAPTHRVRTPWYLKPARWVLRGLTSTWGCKVCGWAGFRFGRAA